jgi:hypothetical protein
MPRSRWGNETFSVGLVSEEQIPMQRAISRSKTSFSTSTHTFSSSICASIPRTQTCSFIIFRREDSALLDRVLSHCSPRRQARLLPKSGIIASDSSASTTDHRRSLQTFLSLHCLATFESLRHRDLSGEVVVRDDCCSCIGAGFGKIQPLIRRTT